MFTKVTIKDRSSPSSNSARRYAGRYVKSGLLPRSSLTLFQVIQEEVTVWKDLSNEYILKFIGACAIAVKPFVVCELKRGGHILEYLKNKPGASRRKLVRNVFSASAYSLKL